MKLPKKLTNKQFVEAGRRDKAIQIAADIIRSLSAKKIKPTFGSYLRGEFKSYDAGKELQGLVPKLPPCKVCARGAAALAVIMRVDNFVVTEYMVDFGATHTDMDKVLRGVFTKQNQYLIEVAFEAGKSALSQFGGSVAHRRYRAAFEFGRTFKSPDDRLKAIMENVIKNEGTFDPLKP